MEEDIQRTFEFLYFGKNRRAVPDHEVLNKPLLVLLDNDGQLLDEIKNQGNDIVTKTPNLRSIRSCNIVFQIFAFPTGFNVYHLWEEYPKNRPDSNSSPYCSTRIRLFN